MTSIDLAAAPVLLQFGLLAVGMASWLDDDGSGDPGEEDLDADDDFDDEFQEDLDADDDFGSFDDADGGGGTDASVNELESRIEELETEVSNVASKANTVRSENEQISESVEDVEENVRKLLEIYEMVTRGVNPFVDDVNADAMGGGDQSFGLFDEEGEGDGDDDELDADIADADADEFFDDALDEDEDEEGGEFDDVEGEAEPDDEGTEGVDGEDADEAGDDEAGDDEAGDDGTSFEDLKEEYESGDAEWADESDGTGPEAGVEGEGADDLGFDDSDLEPSDVERAAAASEFEFQDPDEVRGAAGPGGGPALRGGAGPHLAEPPSGYLADVVCLEWLDHLLAEFGPKQTVRTINYYERIGWVGEPVRDQLFDYLEGLTDSDYLYREEFGSTELTKEDHLRSLDYIEELASEDIERAIVDRFEDLQGDGIQR